MASTQASRCAIIAQSPPGRLLGKIRVAGASGRTLYLLSSDGKNKSTFPVLHAGLSSA
jgi:hypothetical protein